MRLTAWRSGTDIVHGRADECRGAGPELAAPVDALMPEELEHTLTGLHSKL
jgi:hypothetical protein